MSSIRRRRPWRPKSTGQSQPERKHLTSAKQLYGYTLGAPGWRNWPGKGILLDTRMGGPLSAADTRIVDDRAQGVISRTRSGAFIPAANSPGALTGKMWSQPPSKRVPSRGQHEVAYYISHWPVYMNGPGLWGRSPVQQCRPIRSRRVRSVGGGIEGAGFPVAEHLGSDGYRVQAADGEIAIGGLS